jgi:hypothetical protein
MKLNVPIRARLYISIVIASGTLELAVQMAQFGSAKPLAFWALFLVTVLTSGLKVRLPNLPTTLSVNTLFIIVAVMEFSAPESMLVGVAGTVVQCLWRPRVPGTGPKPCNSLSADAP